MSLEKKLKESNFENKKEKRSNKENLLNNWIKKKSYSNLYLDFNETHNISSRVLNYNIDVILDTEEIGNLTVSLDYEYKNLEWIEFFPYYSLKNRKEEEIKKKFNYIGTLTHFITIDSVLFEILDYDYKNVIEWRSLHDWESTSSERKKHLIEIFYKEYGITNLDNPTISNFNDIPLVEEFETIFNYIKSKDIDIKSINTKLNPDYFVDMLNKRILKY